MNNNTKNIITVSSYKNVKNRCVAKNKLGEASGSQMFSHEKIHVMLDKRAASDVLWFSALMFTCCIIFNLSLKALEADVLLVTNEAEELWASCPDLGNV